jgi:glutathione S-transferase
MRLIGNFLSPYVRRVAVSLNILELPFELEEIFVFKAPHVVRRYNPLVRIPVLMLDDGANLVESGAILDEIDRMVGPEHCLTPSGGLQRRRVVQTTAIAVACAEKAQWAFYEGRFRPAEKVHAPWIEHNENQVLGGFEHLNLAASEIDVGGWIAGTPKISQADVTTAVAFTFADTVRPMLELAERFPRLSNFVARCEDQLSRSLRFQPSPTDATVGPDIRPLLALGRTGVSYHCCAACALVKTPKSSALFAGYAPS